MKRNINQFNNLFWFLPEKNLDQERDKNLIIHQVLSYGTMDDLRLLFKIYGRQTIKQEFLRSKLGLYYPNILEFVCFILGVKNLDKDKYLKKI
ncbi:hypothetical protein KJ713_00545 [Patescibacteria group bacterium]|nr:hypothetical protein [Patescibacteria group bacterium]